MKIPPGYKPFEDILDLALKRTAFGKGMIRHGDGKPFLDQDVMIECRAQKGPGFPIGQIRKKAKESMRLSADQALEEMLDVVVYAVAAALWYQSRVEDAKAIVDGVDLVPQSLTVKDCKQLGLWPEWDPSIKAGHTDYDD